LTEKSSAIDKSNTYDTISRRVYLGVNLATHATESVAQCTSGLTWQHMLQN